MCKCLGIEGNYGELQSIFEMSLPIDVPMYKEFHALIVEYGKAILRGKNDALECILIENGKM